MVTKPRWVYLFVLLACLLSFKDTPKSVYAETRGGAEPVIQVKSGAFTDGAMIPRDYTCEGKDISPPLAWDGVPEGTKSLSVICDDPDAPGGTWVHWVLFNLPATVNELPQNIPPDKILGNGAKQGINDFRRVGYGGPCPPPGGPHRYYFKIYALDTELMQAPGITKAALLKAMKGHILGKGQLMGRSKR